MMRSGQLKGGVPGLAGFPVLAAAAILVVVLVLMARGVFVPLNGLFYDAAIRSLDREAGGDVVTIEVPAEVDPAGVDWGQVTQSLLDMGARTVAFTFPPPGGTIPSPDRVVIPTGEGGEAGARLGALTIPPSQYGMHRTQAMAVVIDGDRVPTLEAAVAGLEPGRPFYVRFPGGRDGIPQIGFDDLVANRIPDALVDGRVALLGRAAPGPGLTTPLDPWQPTMAPLTYHAFALQTLLSGEIPRALTFAAAALLVVGAGVLASGIYQQVDPRQTPLVAAVVTFGVIAVAVTMLFWAERLLPVAELLLSQGLLSLLIWRRREIVQDRHLRRMARSIEPADAPEVGTFAWHLPWANAALDLDGSLVLGLDEHQKPIEIAEAGLGLSELDPEIRTGRSAALAEVERVAAPMPLDEGTFWIVPLAQGGRPVGYWVLKPSPETEEDWTTRLPAVSALAADLAWAVGRGPVAQADGTARKPVDRDLTESLSELRERFAALRAVLEQASSQISVRDLLGFELVTTSRFGALIDRAGVERSSIDPVQLLTDLTDFTAKRAAAALRFAMVERTPISVPVRETVAPHSVLRLSCFEHRGAARRGYLMFEVVDMQEAAQAAQIQRTVSEQLDFMLRNDLEAVQLAAYLIARPGIAEAMRARAVARLGEAVERARARLADVEPFLRPGRLARHDAVAVLDLQQMLAEVTAERAEIVDLDMPEIMAAAIAEPAALRAFLRAAVAILAEVAGPEGRVLVFVAEGVATTRIELSAAGIGWPERRLKDYLDGARRPHSPDLRTVVETKRNVGEWGGSLEASSATESGLRFGLVLKKLV